MRKFLFLLLFPLLLPVVCLADPLEDQFRTAPMILPGEDLPLKGLPLWHTNGLLTDELIHEFFEKGTENGFGGFTFLPLGRNVPTEPRYLTDGYFEYFGKILTEAEKRGEKIIFYDDVDFPSGTAGGKMWAQFPDLCVKRLDQESWDVQGPKPNAEFKFSRRLNQNWRDGMIQAVVAMNLKTWERVDLSLASSGAKLTDEAVQWSVPDGDWKVMVFYALSDGTKVDNMSPEAMRKFISLTYEEFYKRFPQHFGKTLPYCFFDDVTITQTQGGRNWTPGFNQKYTELYGRSPALDYPAIFFAMGPETSAARVRIWTTRNELFADGYPKEVHDWCAKHGMKSSGHPQGPYVIQPLNMCGDEMLTHRSSDAPLFDSIHYYGHGREGFKVPSSAAYNFDKPLCLVEIYGNYRDGVKGTTLPASSKKRLEASSPQPSEKRLEASSPQSSEKRLEASSPQPEFDETMLYRSAMEIFCRGGNVLLPHGIWTDPAKMYIPPDISWRNPNLHGELPQYGDWVSRISLIMRHSRHVADVGIVYPIENLKAFYYFHKNFPPGEHPYGLYIPPETDYMAVGGALTTRVHRDYTYLHPVVMTERCGVGKNAAGQTVYQLRNKNNFEEYQVLILTGSEVISVKTLEQVADFYRAGGKVLATTRLPDRAAEGPELDVKVCALVKEMFGVDPSTQGVVEAKDCGQNDIVLPEHYRDYRRENAYGQWNWDVDSNVPGKPLPMVKRDRAIFLPEVNEDALRDALDALISVPDVKLESADGSKLPAFDGIPRWSYDFDGMVQYIHKVKDGKDFYLIANSSDSPVNLNVSLRGTFRNLATWDPMTGEMKAIPAEKIQSGNGFVTIKGLKLEKIQCIFIVAF